VAESRRFMLHSLGVVAAAGLLASSAARTGGAQTVQSSAVIGIAPVVQIRSVSAPSTRRLGAGLLEVTQQVSTAANARYNLNVLSLGDATSRVLVQSVNGAFVPVTSGNNVVATRGDRGRESVTTVVLRIETTTGRTDALELIAFQAVAESPTGALAASAPVASSGARLASVALRSDRQADPVVERSLSGSDY